MKLSIISNISRIYTIGLIAIFLLLETGLFAQIEDNFNHDVNGSTKQTNVSSKSNISVPDLNNKNTFELSTGFLNDREFAQSSNIGFGASFGFGDFQEKFLNGQYFQLKYCRQIFKDDINSLSIGLEAKSLDFNYFRGSTFITIDSYYGNYTFNSSHQVYQVGPVLSNRFNLKIRKLSMFLDMKISSLFKFKSKDSIELWDPFQGITTEDLDLATNGFIGYFGLTPGVEFTISEKFNLYLSWQFEGSINPIYDNNTGVDFPVPVDDQYIFASGFTFGLRL